MRRILIHIVFILGSLAIHAQEVHLPNIPASITDSDKRSLFLAEHFWECNNMADTLLLHQPTVFLDYIYILSKVPKNEAIRLIADTADLSLSHSDTYSYTEYWFEQYLHDSLSPFYDDELFISFLQRVIDAECDDDFKIRPKFLLSRCQMNRVGSIATNSPIHLAADRVIQLFDIQAEMILLWFYDNGCKACEESAFFIKESSLIKDIISSMDVAIVPIEKNVNPDLFGQLYEIQYTPAFYILDSRHRVVLKEATTERLMSYLENIRNKTDSRPRLIE